MKGRGQELWTKARALIPGGNLLSKRSERFLPDLWPAYYSSAKGCEVTDLDGNRFYDFAQMGVGACTLGYADPDVNAAVIRAIEQGSMTTLNPPEEVDLAERLLDLHPWASMVRYARSGGEVVAIAVRIARAAAGKAKVAFSGYHGWHDWYLAANIAESDNLDGQLMPGLEPKGVARQLRETALPFRYNRLDELEALAAVHPDIGVIIMEPRRSAAPEAGFLEGVRAIADRLGAVLIFDEITSGFRINFGGIHLVYGVEPDMAVFGKALGNGFPIAAVVGRESVMDAARDTFISSTFWTERMGFAAALATLDKLDSLDVPTHLTRWGERVSDGWRGAAGRHGLKIEVDGIPPLTHLAFKDADGLELQTLFAQEMLDRGFLAGAAVYTTYAYTEEIVDGYLAAADEAFGVIRSALDEGAVRSRLRGRVIEAGFGRLA